MLLKRGSPRDQAEAQPIIDHGEPAAGKLHRADQSAAELLSRNDRPPFPAPLGGECLARALDVTSLQLQHQISWRTDSAVAKVGGIALVSQPTTALGQCRRHFPAESVVRQDGTLPGRQLAVEPGRAVMADLLLKARRRENGDPAHRPVTREIVRLPAFGKIGRNAPLVSVDPLDMARPAQRLQAPDMGSDVGGRIAAQTLDDADQKGWPTLGLSRAMSFTAIAPMPDAWS
jgi:hypothetical protein